MTQANPTQFSTILNNEHNNTIVISVTRELFENDNTGNIDTRIQIARVNINDERRTYMYFSIPEFQALIKCSGELTASNTSLLDES